MGSPEFALSIFPPVEGDLLGPDGPLVGRPDGLFTAYAVRLAARDIQLDITKIGAAKAIVDLPQDAWRGVADIILSISYRGDVGNATIDGALISDNFANGAPWEIGLRRHAERLREQAIDLYITPLRQGQAVVSDSAMAAQQSF